MKAGGRMIYQMVKEDFCIKMVVITMETGKIANGRDLEFWFFQMEEDMRVIGMIINSMEKDIKHGPMTLITEELLLMERKMGMGKLNIVINSHTMGNFLMVKCMEKEL